jgi:hypothetical protein
MKRSRLTKSMLKRLINEEIEKVEEGGMVVPYKDNPRRGRDWAGRGGGRFRSSGPNPDDALSPDQLFALFSAGFSPQSVAHIDKTSLTPDMISALQSAGLM